MPVQLGNITLFDVQDLAKKFRMNPVSVRTLFRQGRLKGRKLGKRWYVTEDALRDYFKKPEKPKEGSGPK
jgi:hypothetical protein